MAAHGGSSGRPWCALGLPDHGGGLRTYPDNASLTEWAWTGVRWWLVRYNDAGHLDYCTGLGKSAFVSLLLVWVQLEAR